MMEMNAIGVGSGCWENIFLNTLLAKKIMTTLGVSDLKAFRRVCTQWNRVADPFFIEKSTMKFAFTFFTETGSENESEVVTLQALKDEPHFRGGVSITKTNVPDNLLEVIQNGQQVPCRRFHFRNALPWTSSPMHDFVRIQGSKIKCINITYERLMRKVSQTELTNFINIVSESMPQIEEMQIKFSCNSDSAVTSYGGDCMKCTFKKDKPKDIKSLKKLVLSIDKYCGNINVISEFIELIIARSRNLNSLTVHDIYIFELLSSMQQSRFSNMKEMILDLKVEDYYQKDSESWEALVEGLGESRLRLRFITYKNSGKQDRTIPFLNFLTSQSATVETLSMSISASPEKYYEYLPSTIYWSELSFPVLKNLRSLSIRCEKQLVRFHKINLAMNLPSLKSFTYHYTISSNDCDCFHLKEEWANFLGQIQQKFHILTYLRVIGEEILEDIELISEDACRYICNLSKNYFPRLNTFVLSVKCSKLALEASYRKIGDLVDYKCWPIQQKNDIYDIL